MHTLEGIGLVIVWLALTVFLFYWTGRRRGR